uniref:Exostosin GT47 domain-containing protein n=1 Tax=Oryza brachyantha TaxID=4533 RepID=J3N365_ORYBR
MGGRDHFFTAGLITWDFRRLGDGEGDWGSKLFSLPAIKNMTALVVEASPWHLNDVAIPFPTAFHPASDEAVFVWQDKVRRLDRPWLFSFAGAGRPGSARSIRGELIAQCRASSVCSLMECADGPKNKCGSAASYMKIFQSSTFCLQPQGDSYTRKSAFDSMLAGCIPVFFHPGTAYVQYTWHLPKNHADYSVYISEHDPSSKLDTMKDAFDVTMDAIVGKVTKLRRDIVEGRGEEEKLEIYSWKYPLLREGQKVEDPHEWDPLFAFA